MRPVLSKVGIIKTSILNFECEKNWLIRHFTEKQTKAKKHLEMQPWFYNFSFLNMNLIYDMKIMVSAYTHTHYIHIYRQTCIHIHIYTQTCTHIYMYIQTNMHTHIYTHIHTNMHTHTHTHTHLSHHHIKDK